MAGRVDHERSAVAEIDEVGGVAETFVDERDRIRIAADPLRHHPKPPRVATRLGAIVLAARSIVKSSFEYLTVSVSRSNDATRG